MVVSLTSWVSTVLSGSSALILRGLNAVREIFNRTKKKWYISAYFCAKLPTPCLLEIRARSSRTTTKQIHAILLDPTVQVGCSP
jgi:hypothetical protein